MDLADKLTTTTRLALGVHQPCRTPGAKLRLSNAWAHARVLVCTCCACRYLREIVMDDCRAIDCSFYRLDD